MVLRNKAFLSALIFVGFAIIYSFLAPELAEANTSFYYSIGARVCIFLIIPALYCCGGALIGSFFHPRSSGPAQRIAVIISIAVIFLYAVLAVVCIFAAEVPQVLSSTVSFISRHCAILSLFGFLLTAAQ